MRGAGAHLEEAAMFDAFYLTTSARLVRQLALLTGDLGEAEDVTQEAYARAWLAWPEVRDYASPEAWVRTVARRLAVSRWRRMRNATLAWARHGSPAEPRELDPSHVALVAALGRLPHRQRVAVVLHHLADLPVEEVARETGASVSAVKQQLVRGRAALAGLLADDEPPVTLAPSPTDTRSRGGGPR
jgi:RNA polymerase sigma-70 factor, ECF subfamily